MSAIDFLRQLAESGQGNTSRPSTRFLADAQPLSAFADIPLPGNTIINALAGVQNPITQAFLNFRPMIVRTIPDIATKQPTPDLVMLVNPSDLRVAASKTNVKRFTRAAWNIEKWGDNLDKFTANGTTGAFFTTFTGLTHTLRESSAALQALYSLFIYYKSNAKVLIQGFDQVIGTLSTTTSFQGAVSLDRIKAVGEVQIEYGATTYIGSFDSFSITDSAYLPFRQEYSFSFDVRKTVFSGIPERIY